MVGSIIFCAVCHLIARIYASKGCGISDKSYKWVLYRVWRMKSSVALEDGVQWTSCTLCNRLLMLVVQSSSISSSSSLTHISEQTEGQSAYASLVSRPLAYTPYVRFYCCSQAYSYLECLDQRSKHPRLSYTSVCHPLCAAAIKRACEHRESFTGSISDWQGAVPRIIKNASRCPAKGGRRFRWNEVCSGLSGYQLDEVWATCLLYILRLLLDTSYCRFWNCSVYL